MVSPGWHALGTILCRRVHCRSLSLLAITSCYEGMTVAVLAMTEASKRSTANSHSSVVGTSILPEVEPYKRSLRNCGVCPWLRTLRVHTRNGAQVAQRLRRCGCWSSGRLLLLRALGLVVSDRRDDMSPMVHCSSRHITAESLRQPPSCLFAMHVMSRTDTTASPKQIRSLPISRHFCAFGISYWSFLLASTVFGLTTSARSCAVPTNKCLTLTVAETSLLDVTSQEHCGLELWLVSRSDRELSGRDHPSISFSRLLCVTRCKLLYDCFSCVTDTLHRAWSRASLELWCKSSSPWPAFVSQSAIVKDGDIAIRNILDMNKVMMYLSSLLYPSDARRLDQH